MDLVCETVAPADVVNVMVTDTAKVAPTDELLILKYIQELAPLTGDTYPATFVVSDCQFACDLGLTSNVPLDKDKVQEYRRFLEFLSVESIVGCVAKRLL